MTTETEVATNAISSGSDRRDDVSQSIEWYAEGQTRIVETDGLQVTIRFVGRKGRRARIAITAPAGAVFLTAE